MRPETYTALLKDLQKLQKTLVASQLEATRRDPALAARMARLHAEAEVGGRLDDFVGTAARKSTVLFLLRSVFVRVLEDLGILGLKRIRDDWGFAAFREVAPALGLRAYFAFVFRDLAVDFPALFSPSEDELPLPSEDGCRALWNLWHHPNRDGEHYTWDGEGAFESRFLGDLYQDLDADIRKRYALLQTPRFVEEYILDHTLTPALVEFDPARLRGEDENSTQRRKGEKTQEEGGDRGDAGDARTFRLLDPTCGSGHFLIGAFHRLADYWKARDCDEITACERALEGVWGCDINPHAVEIAHFRLLLEYVTRTGVRDLERLAKLRPHLRAMDSLIPWERASQQVDLFPARDRLDAYATPKQREENAAFLGREFHVVVGNPPYITPKDVRKRDDYRVFWPDSASGKYSLSAPFMERFLGLGVAGAFSGQITSNSFMRREFGSRLIERVLPTWDLTRVIDSSGARIPGHGGTPTAMIFARSRPPVGDTVSAILGKRGEPKAPLQPEQGAVWSAIVRSGTQANDESPFITVADLRRAVLESHPWSLGGGAAQEIKATMEENATHRLSDAVASLGLLTKLILDDVYLPAPSWLSRRCPQKLVHLVEGDQVRDWSIAFPYSIIFPYSMGPTRFEPDSGSRDSAVFRFLWSWRVDLWKRRSRASKFAALETIPGAVFFEYPFFYPETLTPPVLAMASVATHGHTSLDRAGRLYKETTPAIKLAGDKRLSDYFDMAGVLNSSSMEFWGKQVFHNKGNNSEGGGLKSEAWEQFIQRDTTKLRAAPLTSQDAEPRMALAEALDATAQARAACLPAALLAAKTWSPTSLGQDLAAAHERFLTHTRRMVALQEELDWLTYGSYGLIEPVPIVAPESVEPLAPGHRPFEIVLARKDDEADDDEKSAWWSRHGHERVTEIPAVYSEAHRARLQQRIELIESDARLALLETPPYKRRWQLADWPAETKKAAESWLLDRLEDLFAPAGDATPRGPLAEPKPYRLEDIALAWSRDPRVAAVAGVWTGTGLSVDLTLVAEKLLRANALPDNPHRVYSGEGLRKLAEWKRVWALQDQEDAGLPLTDPDDPSPTAKRLDAIPLPPKFDKADFVRAEYFATRGKLNVPRERFIVFAELQPNRFGWNGWRDRERALAQVDAYTLAEGDPLAPLPAPTSDDPRRCGVTFGLWESLPDVRRWGAADEHAELQALAREACRQPRCPCPLVEAWKPLVLHAKTATAASRQATAKANARAEAKTRAAEEASVSLAQRAWVADLFRAAEALDAGAVWARHQAKLAEPVAGSAQLTMALPGTRGAEEHAGLDEAKLARVLDDLVASGDLDVTGRGKKKRYQVVGRAGAQ
ncbi:MAG TPA: BREX-2 system adenine-specific DNA-methyltransferase PglX [Polyangiaceae bacterium]|nr:BREX-2 system adenine-specific DNA-methyltransferase PglX [Polyangiaceae bacterium]